MQAWEGNEENADVMGPSVISAEGGKPSSPPPLKNGSDIRESGYLIAVGSRTARLRRKHQNKFAVGMVLTLLIFLLCLAITMTVLYVKQKRPKPLLCETRNCLHSAANLALSMDLTADPCEDFYQYVCGNWEEEHPRVADDCSNDWFSEKQQRVYAMVRDFLATNDTEPLRPVQQAKDAFAACMDTETTNARSLKPAFTLLESLGLPQFPTFLNLTAFDYSTYTFDWLQTVISVKTQLGMDVIIGFDIYNHPRNSSVYRLVMGFPETLNPFPSVFHGIGQGFRVEPKRKKRHLYRKGINRVNLFNTDTLFDGRRDNSESKIADTDEKIKSDDEIKSDEQTKRKLIFKVTKGKSKPIDESIHSDGKAKNDGKTKNDGRTKREAETNSDEETKKRFFVQRYAKVMKLFVEGSDVSKDIKLSEEQLIENIMTAAEMVYDFSTEMVNMVPNNISLDDLDQFEMPEYTVDELQAITDERVRNTSESETPSPIWKRYLEGVFSVSNVMLDFESDKVLVHESDLEYLSAVAARVARTSPAFLELYIWMRVVGVTAQHTTAELRDEYEQLPRWYKPGLVACARDDSAHPRRSLQCASAVEDMLGMAVAYAVVDPLVYNTTKPKIQTMISEMKRALAHMVSKAKWMDDDTKLATYMKIAHMKALIGCPDWLHDEASLEAYYAGVEVSPVTHLENMISVIQVKLRKALNRFRERNNYTWFSVPTEVNAYHTYQENTITVPMVMLQYPFFDLGLDSLNYGALGSILGHEITHGFDNIGRRFDKDGNMVPWWSNQTIESFDEMTQCFVDQYSRFYIKALKEHVNGKQTLGENIADNGGMREALAALRMHLRGTGPEPKLPGFEHMSSEQLFFLSFGNLWCSASTLDSLVKDLHDEHSPGVFRAAGAIQNSADFARAWRCKEDTPMNRQQRCIIF